MFKCLPISGFKQLLDIFLVSVFEEFEKIFKNFGDVKCKVNFAIF